MNENVNTEVAFINTLNANDLFLFPGNSHVMIVESRRSEGGLTSVTYRPAGWTSSVRFTMPGLSTVHRVIA